MLTLPPRPPWWSDRTAARTGSFHNGISYDVVGDGPLTIIFLPGGPGVVPARAKVTRALLEPLADRGFTVWRLTRRRGMPAGHSMADMADDVAHVIDEAFGGHVDAVVGASMGGWIAQFLAARHPEAVGRVVLLASAAVPTSGVVDDAVRYGEALGNGRFTEAGQVLLEEVIPGRQWWPLRQILGPLLGRVLASLNKNPPDVLVEAESFRGLDARPVLSQITAPVLLIVGDEDDSVTPEMVEETARLIADCTLIRYQGRGHAGAIWDERTVEHVDEFVHQPS